MLLKSLQFSPHQQRNSRTATDKQKTSSAVTLESNFPSQSLGLKHLKQHNVRFRQLSATVCCMSTAAGCTLPSQQMRLTRHKRVHYFLHHSLTLTESSSRTVRWSTQVWTSSSLAARATEHQLVSSAHRLRYVRAAASRTVGPEWRSKTAPISATRADTAWRGKTRTAQNEMSK